jgi:hypothetical protein
MVVTGMRETFGEPFSDLADGAPVEDFPLNYPAAVRCTAQS